MKPLAQTTVALVASALATGVLCAGATALPAPVGTQAGRPVSAATAVRPAGTGASCNNVEIPVIGELLSPITNGLCEVGSSVGEAAGGLVGEAAGSVLDSVAEWMIEGATQVTGFVAREMTRTTTPQLSSGWFAAQFGPMADLGAALGLLVALIALASAAVRRSPEALAGTLAGIVRAGLGTGLIVALTMIGLAVADEISNAVLTGSPHTFWETVAHSWSARGFGGFGSSALAMVIAVVEVFAALSVWLELIVRGAAIYLAVLFFPVVLAAAIWPALASWPGRLGRLLLLFVVLKPVAIIVLSFAGNAAAAGLSFGAGGVSGSVGTILAATVILGLAAFAPWTLMYLLAVDAESAYMSAGIRASAGAATTGKEGRSVRTLGGLAGKGSQGGGPAAGASGGATLASGGSGGSPRGGGGGGGGSCGSGPSGGTLEGGVGGGAGGGASSGGGPSPGGSSTGESMGGGADGTLPVGAKNIGAGSIGAAAGLTAASASAPESGSNATGTQPQSPSSSASGGTSSAQSVRLVAQSSSGGTTQGAGSSSPGTSPSERSGQAGGTNGDEGSTRRAQPRLRLVHEADREPPRGGGAR